MADRRRRFDRFAYPYLRVVDVNPEHISHVGATDAVSIRQVSEIDTRNLTCCSCTRFGVHEQRCRPTVVTTTIAVRSFQAVRLRTGRARGYAS